MKPNGYIINSNFHKQDKPADSKVGRQRRGGCEGSFAKLLVKEERATRDKSQPCMTKHSTSFLKMRSMNKLGGGADADAVSALSDELERLRSEFQAYKASSEKRIDALEKEMPNKADKSDLDELENRIMDKLRAMEKVGSLMD